MGRIDKNLLSGESVTYRTRPHWIVCAKPVAFVLLLCSLTGGLISTGPIAPGARTAVLTKFVLASLFLLAVAVAIPLLLRLAVDCVVTNKRVLLKTGIFQVRTVDMFFNRVESVEVKQSILGRILGYGTIVVRGAGGTPEPFLRIAKPLEFQRQVQEQISQFNDRTPATAGRPLGS